MVRTRNNETSPTGLLWYVQYVSILCVLYVVFVCAPTRKAEYRCQKYFYSEASWLIWWLPPASSPRYLCNSPRQPFCERSELRHLTNAALISRTFNTFGRLEHLFYKCSRVRKVNIHYTVAHSRPLLHLHTRSLTHGHTGARTHTTEVILCTGWCFTECIMQPH